MAYFDKVLIANRGEIAIRIIKTLRKLNIKSVAVYSEADTNSLYVKEADEAYFIGNAPSTESYLSITKIIEAVRTSGAQAVHPGYGFLSENTKFAESLAKENVALIGPNADSIKRMGDKIEAKKLAAEAGVSCVPGYMGVIENAEKALEIAEDIGFPVIVKAAAGGGGRGMRVVDNGQDLKEAFISAKREAESCFNDERVFIEKFITKPRHIEIQLLADKFGNAVCLGERECSIQRYHQKVIEEAPSSFIDEETRQNMYSQVISLAKKVGYYSAGTVEFIVDQEKNFYFLEMNTRLQVEHPVTELITDIDIVEQMVKVAAGQKLDLKQSQIKLKGWAIESRINAEDPIRGFLPSSGRITEYLEPPKNSFIRVDSGVREGSEVSMYYDALIAKLCTYGENRQEAIERMQKALGAFVIRGIEHNIGFLEAIIGHQRFCSGDINTNFISEEYPEGFLGSSMTSEITENFLAAAIFMHITEQQRAASINDQMTEYGNRLSTRWIIYIDNIAFPILCMPIQNGFKIRHGKSRIYIKSNWKIGSKLLRAEVNGRDVHVKVEPLTAGYKLIHGGSTVQAFARLPKVAEFEAEMKKNVDEEIYDELLAPLSGEILDIKVKPGDKVKPGQTILILTAMKMENAIIAEHETIIDKIHVEVGDNVNSGKLLVEFKVD